MIGIWHSHLARGLRRICLALAGLLSLAGCLKLDSEEALRARLATWVFLAETRAFTSRVSCTAAVFDTVAGGLRMTGPVQLVANLREGQGLLAEGRVVGFEIAGLSPNALSEALMSVDLHGGLGLVSSFVGPAQACMDEGLQQDVYLALMSPDTLMIYDPGRNAVLLLHHPSQIAFYLRGNL